MRFLALFLWPVIQIFKPGMLVFGFFAIASREIQLAQLVAVALYFLTMP